MNYKIVFNDENYYDLYEHDSSDGSWHFLRSFIFRENAVFVLKILEFDDFGISYSE